MTAPEWLAAHALDECCDLATFGRVTGRLHVVEIWFGVMDGAMYVISGNGIGADWFQNLLADPRVWVTIDGVEHEGRASVVHDPEERHRCGDLMGAKYVWDGDPEIGLTYQAWCYEVPAIAIEF